MEKNEEAGVDAQSNVGEGNEVETLTIPKKEYDTFNQTIGSLKRELKDLKKTREETKEAKETSTANHKPDDILLQRMERLALKTANISHADDVELAQKTAKKWGMDIEEVITDEDFQVKLKKLQDGRSNVEATSGVKGSSGGKASTKGTAEYWLAQGKPPTDTEIAANSIPRKELGKIVRHFIENSGSSKKFYND